MIEQINLTIKGDSSDEGRNSSSSCSLFFTGEKAVLHGKDSLFLSIDDCKAMRDFLNASIRAMESKERAKNGK